MFGTSLEGVMVVAIVELRTRVDGRGARQRHGDDRVGVSVCSRVKVLGAAAIVEVDVDSVAVAGTRRK